MLIRKKCKINTPSSGRFFIGAKVRDGVSFSAIFLLCPPGRDFLSALHSKREQNESFLFLFVFHFKLHVRPVSLGFKVIYFFLRRSHTITRRINAWILARRRFAFCSAPRKIGARRCRFTICGWSNRDYCRY